MHIGFFLSTVSEDFEFFGVLKEFLDEVWDDVPALVELGGNTISLFSLHREFSSGYPFPFICV